MLRDWIAESISSSSVIGRLSWIAASMGDGVVDFGWGLERRSEVIFPGPFLGRVLVVEVMRRTLEGEGVREGTGGVWIRGEAAATGTRRCCCCCC